MIDRRDLLKIGVAAPVALGLPAAVRAATQGVDLWVEDDRYGAARLSYPLPRTVTVVDGDVTPLWTRTLDGAWREPGLVLAGTTGSDVLFVLEQLAWSRGRRVVERTLVSPRTPFRPALVRWRIAPSHPSMKV